MKVITNFLNFQLLKLDNHILKVYSIIGLILLCLIVLIILKLLRKIIFAQDKIHVSKKFALYSLLKYFIVVFSFVIGIQIFGYDLSVLLAGSAALLVGVGLGLQHLFSDFISGIIILVDSSIKVNDVIEINGLVCKVQEIDLRTTTVLTRDDKYIILPNTELTKNHLINWTHYDVVSRFEVNVGVDYSSDVQLVMKILKDSVADQHGVLNAPEPTVRFIDFGDSALTFSLLFWTDDVFRVDNIKSNIRIKICTLFRENNISMPFPQRTLHFAEDGKGLPLPTNKAMAE